MSNAPSKSDTDSWLQLELEDDFDEELEQEIDDNRMPAELRRQLPSHKESTIDRGTYFRELLRLQGELVKFQDWVMHRGLKVVVLFEGARQRRQRRSDQADHPARKPPHMPRRSAPGTI
jgi:polyphosphate kinase